MAEKTQEVAKPECKALSVFDSAESFELAQRQAKMLASTTLVPTAYQGKIAECVIALEMAKRIGSSPLVVMQNLYIVHGKPAWSSQFLIACINASGKFSPIRYTRTGEGDDKGCIAWMTDRTGERLESPRITIGMAKAEGWYSKNGSKWQTMPDLMLCYRSATLLARLYAPELTMGIHTDDELADIIDVTPVVTDAGPNTVTVSGLLGKPETSATTPTQSDTTTNKAAVVGALASVKIPLSMAESYLSSIGSSIEKAGSEIVDGPKAFADAVRAWAESRA